MSNVGIEREKVTMKETELISDLMIEEVKTLGQNKWLENLHKLLCQTKKNWIAYSPSHGHIHLSSKICIYLIYFIYFKGGFIRNDY